MLFDWSSLNAETQSSLTREAMRHAIDMVAGQAELLAREIEAGGLLDRGGPDALRLLAALMRASESGGTGQVGHA